MTPRNWAYLGLAAAVIILIGGTYYLTSTPEQQVTPTDTRPADAVYSNATTDDIVIDLPFPTAVVGKEFSVRGKARGYWFFEASFPVRLFDGNGKEIA
ncbi:MAG: Gmad2 immunoglobulin-like domain-containing protein, partial [Patescibacteria group bacterium]